MNLVVQNIMDVFKQMSSVLTNLSVIQKLAKDLVRARQLNYSQQCIPYYVDESKFTFQHIQQLKNPSGFLLKSSLIRHKQNSQQQHQKKTKNQENQTLVHQTAINSKCIVFLHGLGSSRLQALPLVQCLPKQYCLFAFDFAGSGKSEGQNITYGLRQAEDIDAIIDYLRANKGIKQFIIWGRSMGAVASLLYSIKLNQSSKQLISAKAQLGRIKGLVVDSPFCDFRQITKQIGLKRVKIPQFLLDFALNFIENSFQQLLKDSKRDDKVYNPFKIKLGDQNIETKIPTVFLYSQIDEVVPKEHSQKIVKAYRSLFDKIIMQECSHNQSRPKQIVNKVFESLKKFQSRTLNNRMNCTMQQNVPGHLTRNKSFDMNDSSRGKKGMRRGISVQSKQKQRQRSIVVIKHQFTQNEEQPIRKSHFSIQSYSSLKVEPKKQKISCKMNRNVYMNDTTSTDTQNQGNNSPLKIRLSNSFNKGQSNKISLAMGRKIDQIRHSTNNFYSTIEYDNTILQKKLLNQKVVEKQSYEQPNAYKTLQNRAGFNKGRRYSQLNRKVEYQLNHTRYL